MLAMNKLLETLSSGQTIALKAALALLIATALTFSTAAAVAAEVEGAGSAGTYAVENSESTGLPDMTLFAPTSDASDPAILGCMIRSGDEAFQGEEEGAGTAGGYRFLSSESSGLPDMALFNEPRGHVSDLASGSDTSGTDIVLCLNVRSGDELSRGEREGAGSAGAYAVENSESSGFPDATILESK
jgi:hypothetical protein